MEQHASEHGWGTQHCYLSIRSLEDKVPVARRAQTFVTINGVVRSTSFALGNLVQFQTKIGDGLETGQDLLH